MYFFDLWFDVEPTVIKPDGDIDKRQFPSTAQLQTLDSDVRKIAGLAKGDTSTFSLWITEKIFCK